MNRQQKEAVVADFKDMFTNAQASFLVRYRGLDVAGMLRLRRELREIGGTLRVTKARLMKLAAEGIDGIDSFKDDFKDQVGLVFAMQEVSPIAKQIVEFSKKNKALEIVSGFYESKLLLREEVEFFASLPSKDVLYAMLAGTMMAPVTSFARALNTPMQQFAYALKQLAEKKEQEA